MGEVPYVLRADAELVVPAEVRRKGDCELGSRRTLYRAYIPAVPGVWVPGVHCACAHNEVLALAWRTLGPTPPHPVDDHQLARAFARLRGIARSSGIVRKSYEQIVGSYRGHMKRKYEQARLLLIETPWTTKDAELSSFVKAEKVNPFKKPTKPRLINARDKRYNLELATYLKPTEHVLWLRLKGTCPGVCPTRVVGKGLNSLQRAELIVTKMGGIPDCVAFEVDGAQFEAHITKELLKYEHGVYKAAFPKEVNLARLLECQLELKGTTASGVKYAREGCRASGDFNTGLGNTLICVACVDAVLVDIRRRHGDHILYDYLADGDNAVIFVPRAALDTVRAEFGPTARRLTPQEFVLEDPVSQVEGVTFGQSQPVKVSGSWRMVREYRKVLSNTFTNHRHLRDVGFGVRWLKLVAKAEAIAHQGVPILGPYFFQAWAKTKHYKDIAEPLDYLDYHLHEVVPRLGEAVRRVTISTETRLSFEAAFGISPSEQVALEERLVPDFTEYERGLLPEPTEDWPGCLEFSQHYLDAL